MRAKPGMDAGRAIRVWRCALVLPTLADVDVGGACGDDRECVPPATCEAHRCTLVGNACYAPPA